MSSSGQQKIKFTSVLVEFLVPVFLKLGEFLGKTLVTLANVASAGAGFVCASDGFLA